MHEEVAEYMDHPRSRRKSPRIHRLTKATGASRSAPSICRDVDWLQERRLPRLSAIGRVVGDLRLADGSESADTHYFLLSAKPSAACRWWALASPKAPSG